MMTGLKQKLMTRLTHYFPAIAFFAGFLWDALTLGRYVRATDLLILSAYLLAASIIVVLLGRHGQMFEPGASEVLDWRKRAPYLLLQFLFGSLLSALFILYFRSASHLLAVVWSLVLAGLLVANEFLENRYRRLTLSWSLLGLCTILLLNFCLPFLIGSLHAIWFYMSTFAGAGLIHYLHKKSGQAGRILFVWLTAAILSIAYLLDAIPPVPLVKRDMAVGTQLQKLDSGYSLAVEQAPWWMPWKLASHELHIASGEPVYCVSSVFAPSGLHTRLYHKWQYKDPKRGWQTASRIGFALAGGREHGFRGYTYKQNMAAGDWRVAVETEDGRTVAVYYFSVVTPAETMPERLLRRDF